MLKGHASTQWVSCARLHKEKRTRACCGSAQVRAFLAQWLCCLCRALPGDGFQPHRRYDQADQARLS